MRMKQDEFIEKFIYQIIKAHQSSYRMLFWKNELN